MCPKIAIKPVRWVLSWYIPVLAPPIPPWGTSSAAGGNTPCHPSLITLRIKPIYQLTHLIRDIYISILGSIGNSRCV